MDTSEAGVPETMMQKLSQKEEEAVIQRRSWAQETELHQEQTHKSECERNFLFKHHWWGSVYLLPANLFNRFCPVDFFFNCSMLISDEIIISLWIPGVIRRALFPSLVKSFFLLLAQLLHHCLRNSCFWCIHLQIHLLGSLTLSLLTEH